MSASAVGCAGTRAYISLFLRTRVERIRYSNTISSVLLISTMLFHPFFARPFLFPFRLYFCPNVRSPSPLLHRPFVHPSLLPGPLSPYPSFVSVSFFFLTPRTATSQRSNPVFNIPPSKRVFPLYWGLTDRHLPFNTVQNEDLQSVRERVYPCLWYTLWLSGFESPVHLVHNAYRAYRNGRAGQGRAFYGARSEVCDAACQPVPCTAAPENFLCPYCPEHFHCTSLRARAS